MHPWLELDSGVDVGLIGTSLRIRRTHVETWRRLRLAWIMVEETLLLGRGCGLHVVLRLATCLIMDCGIGERSGVVDGEGAVLLHSEYNGGQTPRDLMVGQLSCCLYFPRWTAKDRVVDHSETHGQGGWRGEEESFTKNANTPNKELGRGQSRGSGGAQERVG